MCVHVLCPDQVNNKIKCILDLKFGAFFFLHFQQNDVYRTIQNCQRLKAYFKRYLINDYQVELVKLLFDLL